MGFKIPQLEGAIFGVVRPTEKHWESVLRHFMQQNINNGDTRTVAAACNAPHWSVSCYIFPPFNSPHPCDVDFDHIMCNVIVLIHRKFRCLPSFSRIYCHFQSYFWLNRLDHSLAFSRLCCRYINTT